MKYRVQVRFIEVYQVDVEANSVKEAERRARAQAAGETGRTNDDWDIEIEDIEKLG